MPLVSVVDWGVITPPTFFTINIYPFPSNKYIWSLVVETAAIHLSFSTAPLIKNPPPELDVAVNFKLLILLLSKSLYYKVLLYTFPQSL